MKIKLTGRISGPAAVHPYLILLLLSVFCSSVFCSAPVLADTTITEFPITTADAGPSSIIQGPDNRLWFTMPGINKIGRSDFLGNISEFSITSPAAGPSGLALGPDNFIWFTLRAENKIAKIPANASSGAQIIEYVLPNAGSEPAEIIAGPDGALWFTQTAGNRIGRITVDGSITEWEVPTPNSQPLGITVGLSNDIWFTEYAANKIGRLRSNGTFLEYDLATADSGPRDIIKGNDGSLWITQFNVNKIARFAFDATITEFDVPKAGISSSEVRSIVNGPPGTPLWFTLTGDNRIGRIAPSGTVLELIDVPTPESQPFDITLGSDGNLWFTQFSNAGNGIARLEPDDRLSITTTSPLPAAEKNQPYFFALQAAGGTAPYTWQLAPGSVNTLPSGLTLAPDGTISGTPDLLYDRSVSVLLTDAEGIQISAVLQITVVNANLPDLSVVLKRVKLKNGVLNATAEPRNVGPLASAAFNLEFYLSRDPVLSSDDRRISSKSIGGLSALTIDRPSKLKYRRKIAKRQRFLIACVDCNSVVNEQAEDNNYDYKKLPKSKT